MTPLHIRFQQVDDWLKTHQSLWQIDSFMHLTTPWQKDYPELASYVEDIDLQSFDLKSPDLKNLDFVSREQSEQAIKQALIERFPYLAPALTWQEKPSLARVVERGKTASPSYFLTGIKGRKWQQIEAFVSVTPMAEHYLEWCAGKGHLGKLLSFHDNKQVHSLEWQHSLCEAGQQEAKRLNLQQTFTQADVLKGEGRLALANTHCAVALHACGDLHRELIEQAVAVKVPALCISPCCYQLSKSARYEPLSTIAKHSSLTLRHADLKLAVKEVATAGKREQRLKQLELVYRLGFDSWQRHARQQDDYLPVPSVQKAILTQGFDAFCHWAAEQKNLSGLIATNPFAEFEPIGEARARQVQKLETISQLFRPALEYWLVLDRAIYLEENGYQVEIGAFCEKSVTPRNWMIRATR